MTKMSPITQNFKTLSKEQLQRPHGLNLDAGKGIKTESYRINSRYLTLSEYISQVAAAAARQRLTMSYNSL